jgi:hypothetical protein
MTQSLVLHAGDGGGQPRALREREETKAAIFFANPSG